MQCSISTSLRKGQATNKFVVVRLWNVVVLPMAQNLKI